MKRCIVLLLCVSLALAGCGRVKRLLAPSAQPTPVVSPTLSVVEGEVEPGAPATAPGAPETLPAPGTPSQPSAPDLTAAAPTVTPQPNPTPDFSTLSFVEKNNLYLELLAQRQAEGADTSAAEDAYVRSLEATLTGDAALADEHLEQAILLLWK